jgi:DNA-binding response OmpR family regulator
MAHLLVVDDDPDLAEILTDLLRAQGHEVRTARDGEEGLKQVAERMPDLVLLDVEMPVLTGPEMSYRMLLHDVGEEKVPVVLLSGVVNLPAVAAMVGTPYLLAKPYDLAAVLKLVARALVERTPPRPRAVEDRLHA